MAELKPCPLCGAGPEFQETLIHPMSGAMERKCITRCTNCGCFIGLEVEGRPGSAEIWDDWLEEKERRIKNAKT